MLTQDSILEARELLAAADREFDAGKTRKGSMLMWEAAQAGLAAVADKYGWPLETENNLKEVVYRLDCVDENGNSPGYPVHFAAFSVAAGFREQAESHEHECSEFRWSDIAIGMGRESVKEFIANLEDHNV